MLTIITTSTAKNFTPQTPSSLQNLNKKASVLRSTNLGELFCEVLKTPVG